MFLKGLQPFKATEVEFCAWGDLTDTEKDLVGSRMFLGGVGKVGQETRRTFSVIPGVIPIKTEEISRKGKPTGTKSSGNFTK